MDAFNGVRGRGSMGRNLETLGKVVGVPGTVQIKKFNRWLTEQE